METPGTRSLQSIHSFQSIQRPDSMPNWLREIDHTGDIGIRVTAPSLETLFARAAWGTFAVLTEVDAVEPRETHTVTVDAADREALMVRWLSELNFLHTTKHRLFCAFDVALSTSDDGVTLSATCRGEPIDADRHTVYTEIKAVTFHGMAIEETDGAWTVQVIFDM